MLAALGAAALIPRLRVVNRLCMYRGALNQVLNAAGGHRRQVTQEEAERASHISRRSDEFQDFLKHGRASRFAPMFFDYEAFFGGEPSAEELAKLYRRNDKPLYQEVRMPDGEVRKLWRSFSEKQIDLDTNHPVTRDYIMRTLDGLGQHGITVVRMDAYGYITKVRGTNCFFVEPDVWQLMGEARDAAGAMGVEILPEIHENYFIQMKLWEKGYYVYDFQLPMLLLNAIFTGKTRYIKNWLKICSPRQFTTLDTHDGIGVVDVRYLMPDDEVQDTKMKVYELNPGTAKIFSELRGPLNRSFNTYQINCSYYSAVGEDDDRYLLTRAVQLFAPGIPQIHYQGLLAGRNDFELFEKTRQPRDVNRHNYTLEEIAQEVKRPVVQKLLDLLRFRNTHPAFGGACILQDCGEHELVILRQNGDAWARLRADFEQAKYEISCSG